MTIGAIIQDAQKEAGKDQNKKLELEILLSFVLKSERAFLLLNYQKEISTEDYKTYQTLKKKYNNNYPLSYITGERSFYKSTFKVNKSTLIPRPESEMIIDIVKVECEKYREEKEGKEKKGKEKKEDKSLATIVDIGTGSGCLIISLAKELGQDYKYYGLDISEKALEIAKINAKENKVEVNFRVSNLLTNLPKQKGKTILIANLPYLTKEQVQKENSIRKEPKTALISGKDGFKDYRNLFKQITKRTDLKNFYLIIEIDPSQSKLAKKEATKYFPLKNIEIIQDLRGKDRFAILS